MRISFFHYVDVSEHPCHAVFLTFAHDELVTPVDIAFDSINSFAEKIHE